MPESGVQVFIFESQVPADMKEYFRLRREKELEKVRHEMAEQGFRPTTAPAQPSSKAQTNEDL
jgi:pentatricopeptide repeat protein